jgi:hypothetical protein
MWIASFSSLPSTPVCLILYEPDKSTKWIVAWLFISLPGFDVYNLIIKIQWDLVDSSFFGVLHTYLFMSPRSNKLRASSALYVICCFKFVNII